MEADRSGGGPNANSGGGSGGAGRNPNGPKAAPGQATSAAATGAMAAAVAAAAAAGAIPGSSHCREAQDGDSGMTLPGILHFIQYEWGRFQAEKYRWEAERDELRVNVFIITPVFATLTPLKTRKYEICSLFRFDL